MSKDQDRLPDRIACLNAQNMPFTLVSTRGFHCDVWRSIGRIVRGPQSQSVDFVLKVGSQRATLPQVRVLAKEHRLLRDALGELVPPATFIATTVNQQPRALVLADACEPWFDLGNPANESETVPMLRRQPRILSQLCDFAVVARRWLDQQGMLIDLVGAENLVLERGGGVRYLDSFHVFFYTDMLNAIDEVDDGFLLRIEQSIERLAYIERLVLAARI